jgi:penicillin-binding protein 1A
MTDLLQSVVASGTGRGAALGRPTAGQDRHYLVRKGRLFRRLFSGLTTGVWIGRDDNKRFRASPGGKNPASAFRAYMAAAVANRPVEQFTTRSRRPEWQTDEPIEELLPKAGMMVDPKGQASLLSSRTALRRAPPRARASAAPAGGAARPALRRSA